jgi:Transposase
MDETRFRSVRWILDEITWKRSDPWLTSFVDCSRDGPGSLLGLAPGRTGGCMREWLGEQSEEFRDAIKIVVIDPSAPYASGIRAALPNVKIAVDKWHLVALANHMVTEVRQRVTRDLLGRRGTVADPVWVNRRLLLTAAEHLSAKQWKRLSRMLDDHDPTNEIGAAWGVRERLRMLLAEHEPAKIRRRLADFYDATIDAPAARSHPVGRNHPDLVASHPGRPHRGRLQRPHRRLQPHHQANQAGRLRLPQHDQLPAPYPKPHCDHPTAEISSMNRTTPAEIRRALLACLEHYLLRQRWGPTSVFTAFVVSQLATFIWQMAPDGAKCVIYDLGT